MGQIWKRPRVAVNCTLSKAPAGASIDELGRAGSDRRHGSGSKQGPILSADRLGGSTNEFRPRSANHLISAAQTEKGLRPEIADMPGEWPVSNLFLFRATVISRLAGFFGSDSGQHRHPLLQRRRGSTRANCGRGQSLCRRGMTWLATRPACWSSKLPAFGQAFR